MWAVRSFSSSRKSVHKRCAMDEEKLKKKRERITFFLKNKSEAGESAKEKTLPANLWRWF